jgi:hypothetical protein
VRVEDVSVLMERVSAFRGEDGAEGRRVCVRWGVGGVYGRD